MPLRGLVLMALVIAASCGGGAPGSAARPAATPTSEVTTVPSGTGGGQGSGSGQQLDRCHTAGLSLSALGRPGAGAGNIVQELGLTSHAGAACTFFGYVGMAMID